jgi:cGMP-dependent protein kinase 1
MGGGASKKAKEEEGHANHSPASAAYSPSPVVPSTVPPSTSTNGEIKVDAVRRVPIFEKANVELGKADIVEMLRSDIDSTMDLDTKELLIDALGGFFFLEEEEGDGLRMDLFLRAMKKETESRGTFIMKEGEPGAKLYVVESGDLEVTINGQVIRHMHRGALIGELALLYNAPRSATVKCLSDCTFWVLSRDMFKNIQTLAASASMMQRSSWLINCPELQALGSVELSRLMGALQTHTYKAGEKLYEKDCITSKVILIEKGSAMIDLPPALRNMNRETIFEKLGIISPKDRRKSVSVMSTDELYTFMNRPGGTSTTNNANVAGIHHPGGVTGEDGTSNGNVAGDDSTLLLYEGCLIGVAILRSRAYQKDYEMWKWLKVEHEDELLGGEVRCPVQIQALDNMQCSIFTTDLFERLYGPCTEVIPYLQASTTDGTTSTLPTRTTNYNNVHSTTSGGANNESRHHHPLVEQDSLQNLNSDGTNSVSFDENNFQFIQVLGKGSYGTVMLAKYYNSNTLYALKRLSKSGVIETGQLRHVLDERRLISSINSPFVVKVFGSYQTISELVIVTEAIDRGDLWSVIYENAVYPKGLPSDLIHFYCASIVLALFHIHSRSIAYRDLKPENIMIDTMGYIRVIDFGFAKKIPYTSVDEDGEMKVQLKSYTLCGTPGKLSLSVSLSLDLSVLSLSPLAVCVSLSLSSPVSL